MEYKHRALETLTEEIFRTFKCVLVTGARQTGKSTMLQKLFPDLTYVTLDDDFVKDQANENPRFFMEMNPPPAIIDEIQKAPALFPLVKIRCDQSPRKGLFCLSGSQPFTLMQSASESLAGRVGILELSPLSLREINQDAFNQPFVPTMDYFRARSASAVRPENLWNMIHRGGYPEVLDENVKWNIFYSSYVSTYLEKDVRSVTAVQDFSDFREIFARTAMSASCASAATAICCATSCRWRSVHSAGRIWIRASSSAAGCGRSCIPSCTKAVLTA